MGSPKTGSILVVMGVANPKKVGVYTPYSVHKDVLKYDKGIEDVFNLDEAFNPECVGTDEIIAKMAGHQIIMIDEFGNLSEKWLTILYQAVRKNPDLLLYVFLGNGQCLPIEEKNNVINYMKSPIIDWMFKEKIEKQYTPGKCRMSRQVFDFFSEFHKNGVS